jgi:tetratricopeptide (TPR) repeat protein
MKKTIISLSAIVVIALIFSIMASSAHGWRINKELKEEIKTMKAKVKADPNDPLAHFNLAITYAYTNNIQDGWSQLKKVNDLDPSFKKKAMDIFIRKVIADPGNWRLRFRLAFAYYFNDQKENTIQELKNVLIIDPYNVWAYGYISLIYGEMDEVDQGMHYVKKGLKIDSNVAALHLLLSEAYYKKGDGWHGFLERMEALRLKALGF